MLPYMTVQPLEPGPGGVIEVPADDARARLAELLDLVEDGLRMEHAAGIDEPLLWLPDSVASATGAARRGETRYLDQLAGLVRIVEA